MVNTVRPRVRLIFGLLGGAGGVVLVLLMASVLPLPARFWILGSGDTGTFLPVTAQSLALILLGIGIGDLFRTWFQVSRERRFFMLERRRLLPEHPDELIGSAEVQELIEHIDTDAFHGKASLFSNLLARCVLEYQATGSIRDTAGVLEAAARVAARRVATSYTPARLLSWMIALVGLFGATIGVLGSVQPAAPPQAADLMTFSTVLGSTLVALIAGGLLLTLVNLLENRVERLLADVSDCFVEQFISRLYES